MFRSNKSNVKVTWAEAVTTVILKIIESNRLLFLFFLSLSLFAVDYSLPKINKGDLIIEHNYYTLKYNKKFLDPNWVAYNLDYDMTQGNAKRKSFVRDPKLVEMGITCPSSNDYTNSGYDRGHQKPAADANFSQSAKDETFYMSNICPQEPDFNQQIWARLEDLIRQWTAIYPELHITVGPVLIDGEAYKTISNKKIAVPEKFYKVILVYNPDQGLAQAIGFVMLNKNSDTPLKNQAISVDKVEQETGIDFFAALPKEVQEQIESKIDVNDWYWGDGQDQGKL